MAEEENHTVLARTFTSFWGLERKFYAVQDIALPVPVSLRAVGTFALTAALWVPLLLLLQVPASPVGVMFYLAIPSLVTFLSNKTSLFQGKTFFQWMVSWAKYFTENKNYKTGLVPDLNKYGTPISARHSIFVAMPKDITNS